MCQLDRWQPNLTDLPEIDIGKVENFLSGSKEKESVFSRDRPTAVLQDIVSLPSISALATFTLRSLMCMPRVTTHHSLSRSYYDHRIVQPG